MPNKNVTLNDFFHSLQHLLHPVRVILQHLLHPVRVIKNTFAAEKFLNLLTKLQSK